MTEHPRVSIWSHNSTTPPNELAFAMIQMFSKQNKMGSDMAAVIVEQPDTPFMMIVAPELRTWTQEKADAVDLRAKYLSIALKIQMPVFPL